MIHKGGKIISFSCDSTCGRGVESRGGFSVKARKLFVLICKTVYKVSDQETCAECTAHIPSLQIRFKASISK